MSRTPLFDMLPTSSKSAVSARAFKVLAALQEFRFRAGGGDVIDCQDSDLAAAVGQSIGFVQRGLRELGDSGMIVRRRVRGGRLIHLHYDPQDGTPPESRRPAAPRRAPKPPPDCTHSTTAPNGCIPAESAPARTHSAHALHALSASDDQMRCMHSAHAREQPIRESLEAPERGEEKNVNVAKSGPVDMDPDESPPDAKTLRWWLSYPDGHKVRLKALEWSRRLASPGRAAPEEPSAFAGALGQLMATLPSPPPTPAESLGAIADPTGPEAVARASRAMADARPQPPPDLARWEAFSTAALLSAIANPDVPRVADQVLLGRLIKQFDDAKSARYFRKVIGLARDGSIPQDILQHALERASGYPPEEARKVFTGFIESRTKGVCDAPRP